MRKDPGRRILSDGVNTFHLLSPGNERAVRMPSTEKNGEGESPEVELK